MFHIHTSVLRPFVIFFILVFFCALVHFSCSVSGCLNVQQFNEWTSFFFRCFWQRHILTTHTHNIFFLWKVKNFECNKSCNLTSEPKVPLSFLKAIPCTVRIYNSVANADTREMFILGIALCWEQIMFNRVIHGKWFVAIFIWSLLSVGLFFLLIFCGCGYL